MAVILSTAGFWAPAVYKVPGDDLSVTSTKLRIRWKRLSRTDRKAMDARLAARIDLMRISLAVNTATPADTEALKELAITEQQFLEEMIVDWELADARGQAVPYTLQELRETCDLNDGFDVQLFSSYFEALGKLNQPREIEKNSDAPSDTTT